MRAVVLTASIFGLLLGAAPAFAGAGVGLTGTWEGGYSCKTEDADGKGSMKVKPSVLTIVQLVTGGPLIVAIDGIPYSGTVTPSAADTNEGAGAWTACGTSDATTDGLYSEVVAFHYKIDADGGGSIKKSSAFVVNGGEVGVCKGSWKRIGLFHTKISGCVP